MNPFGSRRFRYYRAGQTDNGGNDQESILDTGVGTGTDTGIDTGADTGVYTPLPSDITTPTTTTPTTTATPATTPASKSYDTLTGLSPQQQTQIFGIVGSLLSTTGQTIAAIVNSNDQVSIAQLQVAAIQHAQVLESQGMPAQAQQLRQFAAALPVAPNYTPYWIAGGVLIAGVAGWWFLRKK